jgi:hypothetical protein
MKTLPSAVTQIKLENDKYLMFSFICTNYNYGFSGDSGIVSLEIRGEIESSLLKGTKIQIGGIIFSFL